MKKVCAHAVRIRRMQCVGLIAVALLCAVTMSGCSSSGAAFALAVESVDYPSVTQLKGRSADTMTSAYLDELEQKEQKSDNPFATETLYPAYVCLSNGSRRQIAICREDPRELTVTLRTDNGCFVAFRNKSDGGGIFYRDNAAGGAPDTSMEYVLSDRCVDMFSAPHPYCYAVTAWNGSTDSADCGTCLYLLTPPLEGDDHCQTKKLLRIADESTAIAAARGVMDDLYVLTETGLYGIDLNTYGNGPNGAASDPDPATMTCTPIELPPEAYRLGFNSLVYHSSCLYIGTTHGVLQYDLNEKTFVWFPTDD